MMQAKPKLGYIGLGLMGKPMTLRLLAAGYQVSVWNRSRDKLAPVTEKGAKPAMKNRGQSPISRYLPKSGSDPDFSARRAQ